jgi:5'-AMP-activated protein kinase regulatory beta subunit
VLRLPPGQYRLKFIVDDSWRCSKHISTATDDDGTLVNWIEVETPKSEDELKSEWSTGSKPALVQEDGKRGGKEWFY